MDRPSRLKELMLPLREAMVDFEEKKVRSVLKSSCASDVIFRLSFPFEDSWGVDEYYDKTYKLLHHALPDLERRDTIVIAGITEQGNDWVGCGGYYTGVFIQPFLDIPPTGHQVSMRFHEFYHFKGDKIAEMQALWDIPEVMIQAQAWPMAPSLGREWQVPAPATQDGIVPGPCDQELSSVNCRHIVDMLTAMKRHPSQGGPEVMELDKYWHPRMNWYGPSGIGTGRGQQGFRDWHQIPFLNAMPDRGQYVDDITYHFFGDKNYVGVTGWPDMLQTLTHDGWMGIAPVNKKLEMRSLDFWRIENGLIRENWVLVDLLHAYDQIGVDVLARMREFNKAKTNALFDRLTGRAVNGNT